MNTTSVAAGGSLRTVPAIQALTARSGMRATTHATTGCEMAPQPRLDQEDDRKQDQQRAGQSAHDTNLRVPGA